MTFKPDPKPSKREKTVHSNELKRYTCKWCKSKYSMFVSIRSKRSMTAFKNSCTALICEGKAIDKMFADKRKQENKEWKLRKKAMMIDLGIKKKQSAEPLQKSINQIARILDDIQPCLARPTENHTKFDGGHIFGVGAHPSLRYNLWNIHKQSVKSNRDLGGEQLLMIEGIQIRYGEERMDYVLNLPKIYPVIKLNAHERKDALKVANQIIRDLEKGIIYTRDEANKMIGIYL